MDPSSNHSKQHASRNMISGPPSRSATDIASNGENSKLANRTGDTMRRGYSDGDALLGSSRQHDRLVGGEALRDGETWMDFLRHSSNNTGHSTEEQARIATRKAAIMAAVRKRRFTGQQEEHSRRRSASSLTFGQTAGYRMRQGIPQMATNHPLVINPRASENRFGNRIIDRPLPPRPNAERSPDRRSRDITLPQWQPDIEVSDCPICGAHFSFWYRKHHCRKCGRVVCANCSPHRITIPRQFIVHSPQEADQCRRHELPTDSTVIDLIGEGESDTINPHRATSGQNHSHQIDPALGGGQEVRLCNPCVPDPNPLPHPSFASPNRLSFNSFPVPEDSAQIDRYSQHRRLSTLNHPPRHNLTSGIGSNQQSNNSSSPGPAGDATSIATFIGASTSNRRHDRISGLSGVPPYLPPNYSSIYGSAPDPSFREVCLQLYLTFCSNLRDCSVIRTRCIRSTNRHLIAIVIMPLQTTFLFHPVIARCWMLIHLCLLGL